MPREAPVMRAVPFDGELLMFFSPDQIYVHLRFIWIMSIIHPLDWTQATAVWMHIFLGGSMRHCKTEKANTHKRIVAVAAKTFQEDAVTVLGTPGLMNKAG